MISAKFLTRLLSWPRATMRVSMSLSFSCDSITISNFCSSRWYFSAIARRSSSLYPSCFLSSAISTPCFPISPWQQRSSFSRPPRRSPSSRSFYSSSSFDLLFTSTSRVCARWLTSIFRFFSRARYLLSSTSSSLILAPVSLVMSSIYVRWWALRLSTSLRQMSALLLRRKSFFLSSLSQKYFSFLSSASTSCLPFLSSSISSHFCPTSTWLLRPMSAMRLFSSSISRSLVSTSSYSLRRSSSFIWPTRSFSFASRSSSSEVIWILSVTDLTSSRFSVCFWLSRSSSSPIREFSFRISMSKFLRISFLACSSSCSSVRFLVASAAFSKRSWLTTSSSCSQNILSARMSASRSSANFTFSRSSSSMQSRSICRIFSFSSSASRSWAAESSACWLRRALSSASSRPISCDLVLTMLTSLAFSALRLPMRASLLASSTFTSFRLSSFSRCVSSKAVRRWNSSTSCISLSSLLLFSMSSSSRVFCWISPILRCSASSSRRPWRRASCCSSFLTARAFCMMRSSLSLRWSLALLSSMPSYMIFCSLSSILRMWFRCTISLLSVMISAFSFSLAACHSIPISTIWLFLLSSCARARARSSYDCSRAVAWFCARDWKCSSCSWLKESLSEFICCALRQLPCSFSSFSRQISLISSSILRSYSLNFLCESAMNRPFSNSIASSVIISTRTCSSSFFSSATIIRPRSSSIAYSSLFSLARPWFLSTSCSTVMVVGGSWRFFSVSLGSWSERSLQQRLLVCSSGGVRRARYLSLILFSLQQRFIGEPYCSKPDAVFRNGDSFDIIIYYQIKQSSPRFRPPLAEFAYSTSRLMSLPFYYSLFINSPNTREMSLKENQEIQEKVKKSGSFSNKMNQISQKFKEFEQLALYSEGDASSKDMIITIRKNDEAKWEAKHSEKGNLQIVVGLKQPNGPKCIQKILLNLINVMPKPTQSYSVLYVNTLASSNAYSDFKKIMEFLPLQYFKHLEKIYVLHGNLKNKASYWMSFDYLTNYLKNKTAHLDSFKEVVQRIGLNREELLHLLPVEIVAQLAKKEQLVKQIQEIKNAKANIVFNPKIYDIHEQAYIHKKPAVLSSSLLKSESPKRGIEQYEVGQTGAPLIIELLISYFNGKQELLDSEGLFRKSVSIDEEASLLKQLSLENYDCLQAIADPHLIANAIKRFLSNLAEPIIPYSSFDQLMEASQDKIDEQILKIVDSLKNNRKMTILLLVDFLKEKLLPRTEFNKMTENSLSIVFGPCLMHSEEPSMKDLIFTKKSIKATATILKDIDKLFGSAHERVILIRKSVRLQGRQTFKERLGDSMLQIQGYKQGKEEDITSIFMPKQEENLSKSDLLIENSKKMKEKIHEQQKRESQTISEDRKVKEREEISNNIKRMEK